MGKKFGFEETKFIKMMGGWQWVRMYDHVMEEVPEKNARRSARNLII